MFANTNYDRAMPYLLAYVAHHAKSVKVRHFQSDFAVHALNIISGVLVKPSPTLQYNSRARLQVIDSVLEKYCSNTDSYLSRSKNARRI